jgi:hypothetical protein
VTTGRGKPRKSSYYSLFLRSLSRRSTLSNVAAVLSLWSRCACSAIADSSPHGSRFSFTAPSSSPTSTTCKHRFQRIVYADPEMPSAVWFQVVGGKKVTLVSGLCVIYLTDCMPSQLSWRPSSSRSLSARVWQGLRTRRSRRSPRGFCRPFHPRARCHSSESCSLFSALRFARR